MKFKNKSMLALIAVTSSYGPKSLAQSNRFLEQPSKLSEIDIKILNTILNSKKIYVDKFEKVTIKDIQLLQDLKKEIKKYENRDEIVNDEHLMKEIMTKLRVGKYNDLHEKASTKQDMSFTGT